MADVSAICLNFWTCSFFCNRCGRRTGVERHQNTNERTPLLSECELSGNQGVGNRVNEESAGGDDILPSCPARFNSPLPPGSKSASRQHSIKVMKDTKL